MRLLIIILLSFISSFSFAQKEEPIIAEANKLYAEGQFDKAAELYSKALVINPENVKANLNLGNALYKVGKVDEANNAYKSAAEKASEKAIKFKAHYNNGVAFSNLKKLQESIVAYKEALRSNPADEQARENLQKALNEKKSQEQKQQQKQQPKNEEQKKDEQKQKQQNEQKEQMKKEEAEQRLNALRQEEKRIQQNLQKKPKSGGAQEKDW